MLYTLTQFFSKLLTAYFASKSLERQSFIPISVVTCLKCRDLLFLTRSSNAEILCPPNPLANTFSDICSPLILLTIESPSNRPEYSPSRGKNKCFRCWSNFSS